MSTLNVTFKLRRDTTQNWGIYNPTLEEGEIGVDTDLNKFKIGKKVGGVLQTWSQLQFANLLATDLTSAISTHNSQTTSVHGIADTAALATKTYADSAVSTHSADTSNVHGIVDMTQLATQTYVDTAVQNLSNSADLEYVPIADVGNPNGVASLDSTGKIPLLELGNLIDGAPTALNTLNELAAALGDDANFAGTITTSLGTTNTNVSNLNTSVTNLTNTVNQFDARIVSLELGLGI